MLSEVILLGNKSVVILPQTQKILTIMGEQIKMARLRRKLSAKLIAERAGISGPTLWSIEKGSSRVSIGAYAAVLHALNNMDKDMLLIAQDDELGKKLQDLALQTKRRAPKRQDYHIEK
jgi:transcriptional regulator with XRE-family HTH domain